MPAKGMRIPRVSMNDRWFQVSGFRFNVFESSQLETLSFKRETEISMSGFDIFAYPR